MYPVLRLQIAIVVKVIKVEYNNVSFFNQLTKLLIMDSMHSRKTTGKSRQRENPEWFTKSFIRDTRKSTDRSKKTTKISIELSDIIGNSSRVGDTVFISKDMDWWTRSVITETQAGITRGFALSLLPEKNKPSKKRAPKYTKHFS